MLFGCTFRSLFWVKTESFQCLFHRRSLVPDQQEVCTENNPGDTWAIWYPNESLSVIDTSTAQTHSEHRPAPIAHVDCDSLAITAPSVPRSVSREPRLAQLSLLCRVADGRTKKICRPRGLNHRASWSLSPRCGWHQRDAMGRSCRRQFLHFAGYSKPILLTTAYSSLDMLDAANPSRYLLTWHHELLTWLGGNIFRSSNDMNMIFCMLHEYVFPVSV